MSMTRAALFFCLAIAALLVITSSDLHRSGKADKKKTAHDQFSALKNKAITTNSGFLNGKEVEVIRSTQSRAERYFGGRTTVGTPRRDPWLCYVLLSRMKEYALLRHNMEVFGPRCHWAITANLARDLVLNSTELHGFAARLDTKVVHEDYLTTTSYLVKTSLWKGVVLKLHKSYSHVWLMDADIKFADRARLDQIEDEWFCGSVSGSPPLISQPTVAQSNARQQQDYLQVNYFREYEDSPLSTMGTTVVENQIVLADMGFLYWLFLEVIEPYFEKLEEYSITVE